MRETRKTQKSEAEQWRPIEGYNNYEVSNWGRVRRKGNGRMVKICKGYGMRRVVLRWKDEFRLLQLGKLVLEAFGYPQPKDSKPCCIDGNYDHNYLENLTWVERRRKKYD